MVIMDAGELLKTFSLGELQSIRMSEMMVCGAQLDTISIFSNASTVDFAKKHVR